MSDLTPKDGKNFQCQAEERYDISCGDMDSIHGMSNFQVITQESQLLGFGTAQISLSFLLELQLITPKMSIANIYFL